MAISEEVRTVSKHAVAAAVASVLALPAIASAADEQAQAGLQEITVTGSRITLSPGMLTPTPVTSVTQDELVKMAPTNIIDSLNNLPQFFGNNTFQQALGGQSPSGSQVNHRRTIFSSFVAFVRPRGASFAIGCLPASRQSALPQVQTRRPSDPGRTPWSGNTFPPRLAR